MQFTKKISVTLASFALVANMAATPLLASEINLEVSGNGADSSNTTEVAATNNTVVSQTNNATVNNNINANSNTGGNDANKNTGGGVSVDTGNATTLVSVTNAANTNAADVENCNCDADATVKISGNGADSTNNTSLNLGGTTVLAQGNESSIKNYIDASSKTGYNDANRNTGGDVEILTGNAITQVEANTAANSNWAKVGANGHNQGGDVSLWITGNGVDSSNTIALNLGNDVLLQQYNDSYIKNDVDATSKTGGNEANKNTGGSVGIDTGNAGTGVSIDNAANFNWADVDCDCITGVSAKIAGNGYDSTNKIKANLGNDLNVFQDNGCGQNEVSFFFWNWNKCGTNNNVDAYSDTGKNDANTNTGTPEDDPSVFTGSSETLVAVENSGNSNIFGAAPEGTPVPGGNNGVNVNITFNLSDLLAALGLH